MRVLKISIISLYVLNISSISLAESWDCPKLDSEVVAGSFNFEYKSWAWKEKKKHKICHCVRNRSNNGLYIEWSETSLRGFVKPNQTSYVLTTYNKPKFLESKSTLWYGSRPSKIQAKTIKYDPNIVTSVSDEILESEVKTSAPLDIVRRFRNEEELKKEVASSPEFLRDISMKFTSTIDRKAKRIEYSCSYSISRSRLGRWDNSEYLLGFDDPGLNRIMFGTEAPVVFSGGRLHKYNYSPGDRVFEQDFNSFKFSAALDTIESNMEIKTGLLKFISPHGYSVAQLPVRYYSAD